MATVTARIAALPGARGLLRTCGVLAVLSTALVIGQWVLLARVVTLVFTGRADPGGVLPLLVGLAAAWLARSGLSALRDLLAARAASRVRADARAALARKLLRPGPDAVGGERDDEMVGLATAGVARLDAVVARFLPGAVTAAVVAPLLALAVLVLDPMSGVLLVLTGPLLVVFGWLVGTAAERTAREHWEGLSRLGALLLDTLRTLPTLVGYGRAARSARWLTELSEAYRASTLKVLRTAFLSGFVLEFGSALCTALVAVTVGVRLFEGGLELERALLVLLLTPEFFAPLRALGADHHARLEGVPAAERLFAVLDRPEPVRGTRRVRPGVPDLALAGITVIRDGRRVLSGLDLTLPAGSRTALVGPSGAGKSTLARVLLGFCAPAAGAVLVDGVPLTELDPDAWRSTVAYVPERPWLLPGTVADNVRLGRPEASDAEVDRALDQAQALDFVRRLPGGRDEPVGDDGARLSGGERLRIALARALVADPAVVVLDEPTSQLDPAGETAVLAALADLAIGRTVLTISHRDAPRAQHDRVLQLVDGTLLGELEPVR